MKEKSALFIFTKSQILQIFFKSHSGQQNEVWKNLPNQEIYKVTSQFHGRS